MKNEKNDLGAELIGANDTGHGDTLPRPNGPRYCPMCDEFMRPTTCKACGMPTEKVPQ